MITALITENLLFKKIELDKSSYSINLSDSPWTKTPMPTQIKVYHETSQKLIATFLFQEKVSVENQYSYFYFLPDKSSEKQFTELIIFNE